MRRSPFCRSPARFRASGPVQLSRSSHRQADAIDVHAGRPRLRCRARSERRASPRRLLDPASGVARRLSPHRAAAGRLQFWLTADRSAPSWSGTRGSSRTGSLSSCSASIRRRTRRGAVTVNGRAVSVRSARIRRSSTSTSARSLTQAILDRSKPSFEYFAGTPPGRAARSSREVRAGRRPSHPDRSGPPAVSRRPAAARRDDPAARARRHRVHGGAQHHAVARGAQHRQPAGAASSSRPSR